MNHQNWSSVFKKLSAIEARVERLESAQDGVGNDFTLSDLNRIMIALARDSETNDNSNENYDLIQKIRNIIENR